MKHVVASVDEIPPGGRKIVEVAGQSVGIFNVDGEFFALRNRCPHQRGPLCEGKLWGILEAHRPGSSSTRRGGRSWPAPGMGGSFTFAPVNRGAIRRGCAPAGTR